MFSRFAGRHCLCIMRNRTQRPTASIHSMHGVWCVGAWLVILLLGRAGMATAQQVWVRAYEDEEDLWESYQEGEITFEQYLDLLPLFRAGADSVFQPLSDLEELPGYAAPDSMPLSPDVPVKSRPLRGGKHRLDLRGGYALSLGGQSGEEGYFVGRWQSRRMQSFADAQSAHGKPDGFRKRGVSLVLPAGKTQLTLGNCEPRYGLGLVIGRRDRVLGRTEDTRLSGSLWQPKRGNFNGVHVQSAIASTVHLGALGSRIETPRYREDIAAANISLSPAGKKLEMGMTCAVNRISDRASREQFRRTGFGLSVSSRGSQRTVGIEGAVIDGGAAAAAARVDQSLIDGRISFAMWTYDPSFILPSSGGPGHPGRQQVWVLRERLDYYSRTAGEQGALLNVRTGLKRRIGAESVLEVYNDRREGTRNLEGKLAVHAVPWKRTSLAVYLRGRAKDGSDVGESRAYLGFGGRTALRGEHAFTWRTEYGTTTHAGAERQHSVRVDVRGSVSLNSEVKIIPRLRYVDPDLAKSGDGYYYLYLTEAISLESKFDLEIVAVITGYENSSKDVRTAVRVRTIWRP